MCIYEADKRLRRVASSVGAPVKLNEIQMVKGALFVENKGSDGNHTLDETIILLSVSCHG